MLTGDTFGTQTLEKMNLLYCVLPHTYYCILITTSLSQVETKFHRFTTPVGFKHTNFAFLDLEQILLESTSLPIC